MTHTTSEWDTIRLVNRHPRVGVGNCQSLSNPKITLYGVTLDGKYLKPGPRCTTSGGAYRKALKLIAEMDE